ncbi:unnamed protein product [Gadus morhua 'NCC']
MFPGRQGLGWEGGDGPWGKAQEVGFEPQPQPLPGYVQSPAGTTASTPCGGGPRQAEVERLAFPQWGTSPGRAGWSLEREGRGGAGTRAGTPARPGLPCVRAWPGREAPGMTGGLLPGLGWGRGGKDAGIGCWLAGWERGENNRKSIGHPAVSCRVLFLKPSPAALCPQLSLRWLGPRIALLGSTGGVGQDEDETGWDVASWG